ncbi:Peptide chain release factor 2 [Serratia marcescens]|uniref:Peptide chain release factor 2 n=1 Tax=Serratia marcescens TaxID=615 RepID=A0A379YND2_SERMA|nr:Peptide chain release factor 2 [Serratia marcescens]
MFEINPVKNRIQDLSERTAVLRGIFDYDAKKERLEEVNAELEQPDVWNEPERAQALGKERAALEAIVETIDQLEQGGEDVGGLLELAVEADDEETFNEAVAELDQLMSKLDQLEFRRMFSGEYDSADCYLDIQAGSGGTEAQDWASMLLRMYLRWAEAKGFKTEVIEESDGDVAGLKSATIKIIGDYAFGWLRTETGVHRLVRKSPFDSGGPSPHLVQLGVHLPGSGRRYRYRNQPGGSAYRRCTAPPVRAVSTSTKPNPPYVLLTCQPTSWCSARTIVLSIRTRIKRLNSCEPSCTSLRCKRKMLISRRWKTTSPTSAGAAKSVLTCWMTPASRICAPTSKRVTRRPYWMATWINSLRQV